jgi:D-psicose/D-tagatose/L-ribulose 3-epimerase
MQCGINLLLWTDRLHDGMLPVLEMLKDQGYDGVEVPIHDLTLDYKAWGKRLNDLDLRRTASTIRTAADNPISPDPKIRTAAVKATKRTLDCCHALGAELLIGPIHSALATFSGRQATDDEWKWGADSMRHIAEHAEMANVTIGVEYINRFEAYFLTCTADAIRLVSEVNHPRFRMMYDTFHANIEEKDPIAALRQSAPYLVEVHLSENDRGTPGHGHIRWRETFAALKEIHFDGWLVCEAFGMSLPAIQGATKIWRRMFDSEEQLARDSLAHIKTGMGLSGR